jgi:hypothetical protein
LETYKRKRKYMRKIMLASANFSTEDIAASLDTCASDL